MKTATPKTQNQRLLSYLKKNRKGITTMEAFQHLGICRLSERIREIEKTWVRDGTFPNGNPKFCLINITRTRELTSNGATVTRYKLGR